MTENFESPDPNFRPVPELNERKVFLPHSITALILSIVSLANMAFFGWIPAIISMNYAKKALLLYEEAPEKYNENSFKMLQASQKMANIGLVLGILGMFVTALYYYLVITTTMHRHSYYY
jgi:hypothetical protein